MSYVIAGLIIVYFVLLVVITKLNKLNRLIENEAKELRIMIKQLRGDQ